jgi:hypothetical protein
MGSLPQAVPISIPQPILISIGVFLIVIGTLLVVAEFVAFRRGEYARRGPIGPLASNWERNGARTGNADSRRFRFGIRTLLLLMLFLSLTLGCWYCIHFK